MCACSSPPGRYYFFQTKGEPKWKQSLYSFTRLSQLTRESRNNDEISEREVPFIAPTETSVNKNRNERTPFDRLARDRACAHVFDNSKVNRSAKFNWNTDDIIWRCVRYIYLGRSGESRSRSPGIERIRTNDNQEREKLPTWGLPFFVELADHRYRLNENLITLVMPVQRGSETRKLYNWYRQPSIVTSKEIPFFLDVSTLVEHDDLHSFFQRNLFPFLFFSFLNFSCRWQIRTIPCSLLATKIPDYADMRYCKNFEILFTLS